MKWLLVAILVALVATRRNRIGELIRALRAAPSNFREGARGIDDPASSARDVSPEKNPRPPVA